MRILSYYKNKTIVAFSIGVAVVLLTLLTRSDDEKLKQVSKEYKTYQLHRNKTTDSIALQWTITMCAAQPPITHRLKGIADSFSISKAIPEISPHGNKLYKLYIKDYPSYITNFVKEQPIGQVLVKETWNTMQVNADSLNSQPSKIQSLNDGNWYTPTTVSELFIMYKEKETVQNDKGWVYGIISLEKGETKPEILTQGKISSCISCHSGTKYDRIFGVK